MVTTQQLHSFFSSAPVARLSTLTLRTSQPHPHCELRHICCCPEYVSVPERTSMTIRAELVRKNAHRRGWARTTAGSRLGHPPRDSGVAGLCAPPGSSTVGGFEPTLNELPSPASRTCARAWPLSTTCSIPSIAMLVPVSSCTAASTFPPAQRLYSTTRAPSMHRNATMPMVVAASAIRLTPGTFSQAGVSECAAAGQRGDVASSCEVTLQQDRVDERRRGVQCRAQYECH